jgi:hypothetical protein
LRALRATENLPVEAVFEHLIEHLSGAGTRTRILQSFDFEIYLGFNKWRRGFECHKQFRLKTVVDIVELRCTKALGSADNAAIRFL